MSIIVTGCAGFIGSEVCRQLLEKEHEVIGIDNLNDAYDVNLKEYRLKKFAGASNFKFYKIDITDETQLEELSEGSGDAKAIINLAARAGVRMSIDIPHEYYLTNVIGTLNLLEYCKKHNISKFVQASTSSIYGENPRPFTEDQATDNTLSPYAASKKAAENLCYTYHRIFGIDITVLRYFTVYGPAGRPDMCPLRFIKWIAEDEDLVVYGDGEQERDFTYVEDIAEGTLLGLRPLGYEVINLGNDKPVKLSVLIRCIENKLNKKAKCVYEPVHITDVRSTWASIDKAREILGWEPKTDIEKGMSASIEWYENNRDFVKNIKF